MMCNRVYNNDCENHIIIVVTTAIRLHPSEPHARLRIMGD